MGMADTCRVCLCSRRRLHAIRDTLFQEIWEKLTTAKFNTNDGKSLLVCYMCCAQLRKAHQLMKRASEAEKLLTAIVNDGSEQSQNALLLKASETFGFDYKYVIEHLHPLECKQPVRNTVEEIKKEHDGENEEDNEERRIINIKEEKEDSSEEDNLEHADFESDTSFDDNIALNHMLEREDRNVSERIAIGASTRKHTLHEVPQNAKRIKLEETSEDRNDSTNAFLEILPINNCNTSYKSTKESSFHSNVNISKNKQHMKSVVDYHPVNNTSSPKHKIHTKNEIAQDSETFTAKVFCNNAENDTLQQCIPKIIDAVVPSTSLDGRNLEKQSSVCNLKKGMKNELSCHICQYRCGTDSELNRHLRKHTGEKPYACEICDNRFSQRAHLECHIKYKHTKEKNNSCHVCQYKFVTKSELNLHLRKHTGEKPFECDLCDFRCSRTSTLENHVKYKHIKEKNISCHICQYKFVAKRDLNLHLRKHTGEKPFECDLCDFKSSRRDTLENHVKYKHTKEKSFSCDTCQYKCVTKALLNRHLLTHTGEKPYKCDLCDYRCSQKGQVGIHMKFIHTKEKNFSCHMCEYKTVTRGHLNKHLRKHTGEKL